MRRLQVEVVARAIQVNRQDEDGVESVLVTISLRLYQHHLLGQAIGCIGFFGVANPKIIFFEGNGGELGVGAYRTNGGELAHAALPRLVHQLNPHHQVVVKEFCRVLSVGPNAAHIGSQVDDHQFLGVETIRQCVIQ